MLRRVRLSQSTGLKSSRISMVLSARLPLFPAGTSRWIIGSISWTRRIFFHWTLPPLGARARLLPPQLVERGSDQAKLWRAHPPGDSRETCLPRRLPPPRRSSIVPGYDHPTSGCCNTALSTIIHPASSHPLPPHYADIGDSIVRNIHFVNVVTHCFLRATTPPSPNSFCMFAIKSRIVFQQCSHIERPFNLSIVQSVCVTFTPECVCMCLTALFPPFKKMNQTRECRAASVGIKAGA